jgi:phosphatidylserine/phosphatidylglycerophosphate/cardiolipin synthase-like enzyme
MVLTVTNSYAKQPTQLVQGPINAATTALVNVCFVPAQSCVDSIVAAINTAKNTIYVQAYGFTSLPILNALVDAKKRNVNVQVILDKSNEPSSKESNDTSRSPDFGAKYMIAAGIPVSIDFHPAIAHNKVIVIDEHLVIGGSYNYTMAAEHRNAENVTYINSVEIAKQYIENWNSRLQASRPF